MTRAGTRLVPLVVSGPAGPLEALLTTHEPERPAFVAVVCHPHPLYGGTLHNKVVHRTASTLHELGGDVLRFNFRGVGQSAGTHDRGAGELDDARAALEFLRARHPGTRVWLAGFSFGSWVAARLAAAQHGIERAILIAPPVTSQSFDVLRRSPVPKHVFQGSADDICPPAALTPEFAAWAEPKHLTMIESATHFFDKQLGALAQALSQELRPLAQGGTSCTT